jgi:hypothetical protein
MCFEFSSTCFIEPGPDCSGQAQCLKGLMELWRECKSSPNPKPNRASSGSRRRQFQALLAAYAASPMAAGGHLRPGSYLGDVSALSFLPSSPHPLLLAGTLPSPSSPPRRMPSRAYVARPRRCGMRVSSLLASADG